MILDLSMVWLHVLGISHWLLTSGSNSFHLPHYGQHFLSACFNADPFCLKYYATKGVSNSLRRPRGTSRVPSMAAHLGTDGPWKEFPLKSCMDSVNDLPTATTRLVEGFDNVISTSCELLAYGTALADSLHHISKQPVHHKNLKAGFKAGSKAHTRCGCHYQDVIGQWLDPCSSGFTGRSLRQINRCQSFFFFVSDRPIPLVDCLPNSRTTIFLKMDKA